MARCRRLAIVLLGSLPGVAFAAEPFDGSLPHIPWTEADKHYGERCVVYGTVLATRDIGKRTFLNFHPDHRTSFTIVINADAYGKFPSPPHELYRNKHVRVVGEIVKYQDKPEIIATGPEQIELRESPEVPAELAAKSGASAPAEPRAGIGERGAAPVPAKPPATSRSVRTFAPDAEITIATYNVLNLFDDYDDPYIENENPTKSPQEQAMLARTIRAVNADVLALAEVENRGALQAFVDTHLKDLGYEVVLYEGNSDRGIDVALLSRLPIGPVTSHRHLRLKDAEGKPVRFQRDLLQVTIMPPRSCPFDVFVVHLKSKHGEEHGAGAVRLAEGTAIRNILDARLEQNPRARFVICGDFNDYLDSPAVQAIIGDGPRALRHFTLDLPKERAVTYNREPYLSTIDFIFASPALAESYVPGSYGAVPGSIATTGSDHNPVVAKFRLTPAGSCN